MTAPSLPTPAGREVSPPVATRRVVAAALLLSAVFAFWDLDVPLHGSEARWAVVAREMVSSRDYFSMTIAGRPYLDKPFGSYWLVILASKLTGGMSEWTLRLPSVVAYILTAYLVYLIGKRTLGAREGALGALVFVLMFRVAFFSREASADPQTMLGIALALWLTLEASEDGRWWHWPLIGALMASSSLMKGLSGFAVTGFVALLWCVLVRGFRWLRPVPLAVGVLAFATVLGAPFLIAHEIHGGWGPVRLLWRESVVRAVRAFDHTEPWYFYLWNQFELLSPWSVLLPSAMILGVQAVRARARRRGGYGLRMFDHEEDRRRIFPLFCYLGVLLFFSLSGSKRTYYLMPIAPFASLVFAQALLDEAPGWARRLKRVAVWALAIGIVLADVAALALGVLRLAMSAPPAALSLHGRITPTIWRAVPIWLALAGVGVVLGAVIIRRLSHGRQALVPLFGAVALALATSIGVLESMRRLDDSLPRFGKAVQGLVPADEYVELVGVWKNPTVVYYINRAARVDVPAARFVIVPAPSLDLVLARPRATYRILCKRYENSGSYPGPDAYRENYVLLERTG